MASERCTAISHGPEETARLAAALASLLRAGDVVLLSGELGAGKTCFVRGLAHGLGVPPATTINSPTFTLLHHYSGGRLPLHHFDFYRLRSARELDDLAFADYLGGDGVVVVEWPERAAAALPPANFWVTLQWTAAATATERLICVENPGDGRLTPWYKGLMAGSGT
jgi:tRNA threonylcarbamoyladenosine biosynthesis protein TsaE